jgi:hypothetical protein
MLLPAGLSEILAFTTGEPTPSASLSKRHKASNASAPLRRRIVRPHGLAAIGVSYIRASILAPGQ